MAATSTPPPTLATLPEVCLVHVCAFLDPRSVELFSLPLCKGVRAALRSGVALNEVWYALTSREWESTPRYARRLDASGEQTARREFESENVKINFPELEAPVNFSVKLCSICLLSSCVGIPLAKETK